MTSAIEAYAIADKYTKGQGEILPGIRLGVGEMQEFNDCYYFDFKLIFAEPPNPGEAFGGAPGFVVEKDTTEIKTIAFWQLAELLRQNQTAE